MPLLALHHVSIITADLKKSLPFYCNVFCLSEIPRPDFPVAGAWLACGGLQVHLVEYREGTFRRRSVIDRNDGHFAFRTNDFSAILEHLDELGFREDLPEDDPKCLMVSRKSLAGFPQLYLRDPDSNIIEINGAD
ncbi:VOC family protein [Neorhizobium sp. JUb45]|uniref:VOC family protein n=1 Tax=unclassified Neorhizobium TaxID=2629175 RepID=UPI001050B7E3|nr:VOC family protein [Neorhizobium sp. JUb45]TCR04244.1 catechol 2,3-dioxygenase-like lactoylglutathione lyase family enzyme [Neorhizobium sp. JUb45]